LSGNTTKDRKRLRQARSAWVKREAMVGVIVVRDDRVLFGLRRGSHGAGTRSFPGGHPAPGEGAVACALREPLEEARIAAMNACVVAETIDDFPDGLRYRTFFVRADWASGDAVVREPERCAR
jgi:8-oxo-dGTP diphosphatase